MAIKILIADDHKIVRDGLRSLLENKKEFVVVAEAENGQIAVELAKEHVPDCIIMDITMPVLNGIEATRQILAKLPDIKIIALSVHDDKRFVLETLKAGASGYLLKDCAFEELIMAINDVLADKTYLSSKITNIVVDELVGKDADKQKKASAFNVLSPREREVLQLLAEGKNTKEIAHILNVSPKTVETHRKKIMEKLGLNSVAELTKYAIREGLTDLNL